MKEEWIIKYLQDYNNNRDLPSRSNEEQIRMLMNVTMPSNLSAEFYQSQDGFLQSLMENKVIIDSFKFNQDQVAIFQGDITLLKVDAIVNACNEKLLGCFRPLHGCVDNVIHSYAGLQVRRDLMKIMKDQGHNEPNGQCKVSGAYNLPSTYIFHTVGPQVNNQVSSQDELDLKHCYTSCLAQAKILKLKTIAFPCISTGLFGFPKQKAAVIAYKTILAWKKENLSNIKVILDVFLDSDLAIYTKIVGE